MMLTFKLIFIALLIPVNLNKIYFYDKISEKKH